MHIFNQKTVNIVFFNNVDMCSCKLHLALILFQTNICHIWSHDYASMLSLLKEVQNEAKFIRIGKQYSFQFIFFQM